MRNRVGLDHEVEVKSYGIKLLKTLKINLECYYKRDHSSVGTSCQKSNEYDKVFKLKKSCS